MASLLGSMHWSGALGGTRTQTRICMHQCTKGVSDKLKTSAYLSRVLTVSFVGCSSAVYSSTVSLLHLSVQRCWSGLHIWIHLSAHQPLLTRSVFDYAFTCLSAATLDSRPSLTWLPSAQTTNSVCWALTWPCVTLGYNLVCSYSPSRPATDSTTIGALGLGRGTRTNLVLNPPISMSVSTRGVREALFQLSLAPGTWYLDCLLLLKIRLMLPFTKQTSKLDVCQVPLYKTLPSVA